MKLFHRASGQGQAIILLHGIFGSSDNWLTPAKLFSAGFQTYALDLRNHGQSPHDDEFNYPVMAADVLEFVDTNGIEDPVIIGHSMGGKVAMNFALAYPEKLQRLVVVDIAPKAYNMKHYAILEGLKAIPIDQVTTRNEADDILARFVPEADVRQFLLKNLQRKPAGGFKWKLNLAAIDENIERIGLDLEFPGRFDKPTLFVRGSRSNYIRDADVVRIKEVFPQAQVIAIDTGHWVPAEKPKEFVQQVEQWLRS